MPRTFVAMILIGLFLFTCQISVQAKDPDPDQRLRDDSSLSETEATPITGYADILFGSAIRNLNATHLNSIPGIEFVDCWILNDTSYQIFTIGDKTFDATTMVGSLDNATVATVMISLTIPPTMGLDEVSLYAYALRSMYITKYPQSPVYDDWVWGYDANYTDWWIGNMEIDDQDNNCVWISWDGYTLFVNYRTAEYQQAVMDNLIENATDQANKI